MGSGAPGRTPVARTLRCPPHRHIRLSDPRGTLHDPLRRGSGGLGQSPWLDYLHVLGEVLDLGPEIEINLVDVASCRPVIREVIEREGVEL